MIVLLIIGFITSFRLVVLMSFLPAHASGFNLTASLLGIIIAIALIFTGILMPCFSKLADKLSMNKRVLMLIIGSFIGTIIVIVPLCHGFVSLLLVNIAVGIGAAMSMAVVMDIAVLIGKRVGMGLWMGIINTLISGATIVAPLISGAIMGSSGINAVFYFAGILSLVFTLIGCYYSWRWSKARKQRVASS